MEAIELLKSSLIKYSLISDLISEKDVEKWVEKLNGFKDINNEYVYKVNFNILTSLIAQNQIINSDINPAFNLLNYLEDSLKIFPELKKSNEFKRNIKSLDDFSFFSFLSELSLARHLKCNGFEVRFNKNYERLKNGKSKPKNVDIEAIDRTGRTTYFEVYSPFKKAQEEGFLDIQSIGDSFEKKIEEKQYDKFDGLLPEQLNGKIILAINFIYDEEFSVLMTALTKNHFRRFENIIHKEIDGLLFFFHDIAKNENAQFYSWYFKNKLE